MSIKHADGTVEDRCLERVRPGEPFFVLRAQDKTSLTVLARWMELNPSENFSAERIEEIYGIVNAFERWQREYPELVKMPD